MPISTGNENLSQRFIRAFTQRGGPGPANAIYYAGAQEQYLMVGDISDPVRGSISAVQVQDPQRRGLYRRTGITVEAPDIPNASVTFKQKFNGVPWYTFKLDCPINIYESEGQCNDPTDFKNGWSTLRVLSQGLASDRTFTGRTPFDTDDESLAEIAFSWMGGTYVLGGIVLGEVASVDVTTEVVGVAYAAQQNCTDCGPANDGAQWIYALQQTAGGSASVVGKVLYSVDGGVTWTASAITGLGVGALVTAIAVAGPYVIVVASGENAYYYAAINQLTGVPGTWTKVTTGFVALKNPTDIYVESASRIYFCGLGGYIYVSTDVTAGVSVLSAGGATTTNLNRIHGQSGNLFAVGASGVALRSLNSGVNWSLTTTQLSGTVQAVRTISRYAAWAGNSAGAVSYTVNGGETWGTLTLPSVIGIHDIVFPTAEVGYILATRTGPTGVIFGTFDGGKTWSEAGTSRFPSAPTYGRPNRLAYPDVSALGLAANTVTVGGLAAGLADGVIYVGQAPVL